MSGIRADIRTGKYFHNITKIHNRNFMSKGLNQPQIMGNKSYGNIFLFLKTYNQFDNGFLN